MKKALGIVGMLLAAAATPALATPQVVAKAKGAVSTLAATTSVEFEIFLPLRNTDALKKLIVDQQTVGSSSYQKWLTPAQFASQFGPAADSVARVKNAASLAGLSVTATNARSIHVKGTAAQVGSLFRATLKTATVDGKSIVFVDKLTMPSALSKEGARVLSFSGLLPKHPMVSEKSLKLMPDNRYSADGPYWYNDLKQAYDYPSYQSVLPNGKRLDGTGVHVAILMSDLARTTDIAQFFNHENFTAHGGAAVPTFDTVKINGGGRTNGPGSLEATLDLEQVLGGAPGASVTLVSIPNLSDDNIVDGYTYIVNQNKWDLVNSSFGGCELGYLPAYNNGVDYTYILQTYDELFQQGNSQGITFMASSGDEGGLECPDLTYINGGAGHYVPSVSTPADSVYVTAVGGTNLVTVYNPPSLDSAYVSENGYGDPEQPAGDPYGTGGSLSGGYWGAGGGQSAIFPKPAFQTTVNTGSSNRTLPDVGMQVGGCPSSAIQPCGPDRSSVITTYNYGFGGGNYSVIGTSVSSPEFVGATALYVQKIGKRLGNFNNYLYHYGSAQTAAGGVNAPATAQFYHRNIPGFDGYWDASFPSLNYNYIVGNGTPDVRKLFGFTSFPPAGIPQTASNP